MDYKEAMDFIHGTHKFGSKLGLDTIRQLLELMDNPHKKLKFVHVAGTNGKGSTVAFTSSILRQAGYRVGVYTSPSIQRFSERIRINEEEISEDAIATIAGDIKYRIDLLLKNGGEHPTEFEIVTALALRYFCEMSCDVVILEVGLGGRFDATNVIDTPLVSVITTINYDHMDRLGDTLEEIAFQKAGIIKEGGDVILYPQKDSVEQVFREVCIQKHANLNRVDFSNLRILKYDMDGQVFDFDRYKSLEIKLLGEHQAKNAALSLKVVELLTRKGYYVTEEHIRKGLLNAKWPGRLEVLSRKPVVIIDGAHNPEGAQVMVNALKKYFPGRRITFIMGVMADKEYEEIIKVVMPIAERFITVAPLVSRALPADKLADTIKKYCSDVTVGYSVEDALRKSMERAGENGIVCAFGSLYYIGEIRSLMGVG